jgi:hypothetical protein
MYNDAADPKKRVHVADMLGLRDAWGAKNSTKKCQAP